MTVHPKGISTRYDIAKQVADAHQYAPGPLPAFEGVALDATTANVIVTVCEALSPERLAEVDSFPLDRFINFVWSCVRVPR